MHSNNQRQEDNPAAMKNRPLAAAAALVCLALSCAVSFAADPAARVGVYDSRAVAFAHFWGETQRQERDALIARARAAKSAGEMARFKELTTQIKAEQDRSHLQVFSTAPAAEAMAALAPKLPAIQRELGVTRLVSKWDEATLAAVPEANRIDVTDRLAQEFKPDEKRRRTIEEMKKVKPLPLDEAKRKLKAGAL
jgi:hypothetical protein